MQKVKCLKLWHMTLMGLFSGLFLHRRCHYLNGVEGKQVRDFISLGWYQGCYVKGSWDETALEYSKFPATFLASKYYISLFMSKLDGSCSSANGGK